MTLPRTKIKISFAIVLVLLVVAGVLEIRLVARFMEDRRWVEHTYTVLAAMQLVDMACQRVQDEFQDLVLNHEPATIESLDAAVETSRERIAAVRALISDNATQTARLNRFATALEAEVVILRRLAKDVVHGRDGGAATGRQLYGASSALRTITRNSIDGIETQEATLLRLRSARREQSLRATLWLMGAVFATAVLIGLFALWVGLRELDHREVAERSLRASAERLTSVLESTTDSVLAGDKNFRITYLNRRANAVLGDILGEDLANALPGDIFLDNFRKSIAEGKAAKFEARHATLGNWFDISSYPTSDGFSVYFHDITARKALEEHNQKNQILLEATQRMATIGSWEINSDRQVTWSRTMYGIFEHDPALGAPSIERFLSRMIDPRDRKRLVRAYLHSQRDGDTGVYNYELRLPTGSTKHLLMVSEPIHTEAVDGKVRPGMRGFVQDVTEVKSREIALQEQSVELMKARDAAQAGARAKSDFLATMSHEIRTPMNGVIGMTALLLDTTLSIDQREYVSTIRSSGEALLAVINDILDFSKIEAGKIDLEDVDFSLFTTVEECAEIVAAGAHHKGLELILPVSSGIRTLVRGDHNRLRQILLNLLSNAIKFTEKGEIAVTVDIQHSSNETGLVRIEVKDTGPGIPAEVQTRLFQAFSQADSSTTRRFGGTGLGLVISKRLVELMGGQIGVLSEQGKGSTFWFTVRFGFPAYQGVTDRQLSSRLILVVDDNATNRRVLQLQLERHGCEVCVVENASEAISTLTASTRGGRNFDAVLTDFCMPEIDGVMLAKSIRSLAGFDRIPILILSSYVDRERIREAVADEVLLKPVTETRIVRSLNRIFAARAGTGRVLDASPVPAVPQVVGFASGRGHILLAEDNVVNQKVAALRLKKLGYTVDIVANGKAALEAVKTRRYDAILMDCQMPDMDGFEATKEIRVTPGGTMIPIIALTANAFDGEREKCIAAGMNDYLTKPVDHKTLASKLSQWVAGFDSPAPDHPAD